MTYEIGNRLMLLFLKIHRQGGFKSQHERQAYLKAVDEYLESFARYPRPEAVDKI